MFTWKIASVFLCGSALAATVLSGPTSVVAAAALSHDDVPDKMGTAAVTTEAIKPKYADMNMKVTINKGGYSVNWSRIKEAKQYKVYANVTPLSPKDRWETVRVPVATARRGAWRAQVSGKAIFNSVPGGAYLTYGSGVQFQMWIEAYASRGRKLGEGTALTPCPTSALVAVRGTSQNPESAYDNSDGYGAGLGNVGLAFWKELTKRSGLHFSEFPALASDAVADPNMHELWSSISDPPKNPTEWKDWAGEALGQVFGSASVYPLSVSTATLNLSSHLRNARANCPSTTIVVTGFSQGAQVVGDAIQDYSKGRLFDQAALFSDPRQLASDRAVQYPEGTRGNHNANGLMRFAPGIGPRGAFSDPGRVNSWCWVGDLVCVSSLKNLVDMNFHTNPDFEGDQASPEYDPYLCYIEWAGWHAINGLTSRDEIAGGPGSEPSCRPII